jgi:hypothetical protein
MKKSLKLPVSLIALVLSQTFYGTQNGPTPKTMLLRYPSIQLTYNDLIKYNITHAHEMLRLEISNNSDIWEKRAQNLERILKNSAWLNNFHSSLQADQKRKAAGLLIKKDACLIAQEKLFSDFFRNVEKK